MFNLIAWRKRNNYKGMPAQEGICIGQCIFLLYSSNGSANKRGGGAKPVINGAWRSGRGHGAQQCCLCFCLSPYYNYLSILQIKHSRPNPSHSAIESQYFRFIVKIFSQSALAGSSKKIFHWGPNPLLAALNKGAVNGFYFWGWPKLYLQRSPLH
jgi:hypothetical protein